MSITYELENLTGLAPLYRWYAGQVEPQPAHVELDEGGAVSADWSSETGNGVPADVWHGRRLRWRVSPYIRAEVLRRLLVEDLAEDLAAVHAGREVVWDGNNHVGKLDRAASEASERIDRALDETFRDSDLQDQVRSAGDWFGDVALPDLVREGETVEQAAERLDAEAASDGVYISSNVADYLRERTSEENDGE